jgi:arabinofuranan 3-O-arabinosyltransferase
VSAVQEAPATRGMLSRRTPAADTGGPSARIRTLVGYGLLAALAYVPLLLTAPGEVAADTKQYFYLDPGRLLSRAPFMWDPHTAFGTVTHQNIGYLFPAGPYFWLTNELGIPAWISQRLWLGSILFGAGAGLLYLARTLSLRGPGIVVAALAYMLSPYCLQYASRLSTLLIAWAALPWMVALVARALRDGGWRYPAAFAIVVQLAGSVNATALIFAGIGPVLWIVYEVWIARDVRPREALTTVARVGVLCIVASLWWISGLSVQAAYGLDELKYSETVKAVSTAGLAPEILRGLGYWFFYGGDKLAPWTDNVIDYTQRRWLLATSYAIPIGALLAAAFIRWKHRLYFALVILIGLTIAVGTHPYSSPSPFGAALKAFSEGSTAGLALRSVGRAFPLIGLGLAILLGIGVNLVVQKLRASGRGWLGLGVAAAVAAIVIVNLPALWNGTFYGKNLTRPSTIPSYWTDAIDALDAGSHDTRILELPGSDFAAYRWGNTVEPITPGLTDRPFVARELIPYGSDPSADLLTAFDRRLQDGVLDPAAIAPIARLMNAGDIVLRSDLQVDRYDLARPRDAWQLFTPPPPGLEPATGFGDGLGPRLQVPLFDERSLALPPDTSDPPPVAVFPVTATRPIVRTESTEAPLVVSGNGEGLVDLASLGLLEGEPAVLYSASLARQPAGLQRAMNNDASLIVTDSNRRRAHYWNQTHNNLGFTEQAGARPGSKDPFDARLNVFPDAGPDAQTTMQQHGARVTASAYGNVTSLLPEDRPSRVLDGDLTTAWRVGGFSSVDGEWLQVDAPRPITTDRVNLVQPLTGLRNRYITQVKLSFDGGRAGKDVTLTLDPSSRASDGQTLRFGRRTFRSLRITVTGDNVGRQANYPNASSVGFAEVRLRDEHASDDLRVDEVVEMPTDLVRRTADRSMQHPLAYVMTRQRTVLAPPHIAEEEPALARSFAVPTGREFTLGGVGRLSYTAPGPVIDSLLGIPGADAGGVTVRSSGALSTNLEARGSAALDGVDATAWTTPFDAPVGQWLDVTVPQPVTFNELGLVVIADGHHSVPTKLRIDAGGTTQIVDVPPVQDRPTANTTVRVPVTFAPVTGSDVRVTIEAVRPATTTEYFSQTPRVLPAAIAELGIPGVTRPAPAAVLDSGCRSDLATLDGEPLPIRVSGDTQTASQHGALRLEACAAGPIELSAGQHILRATPGSGSGLDLDSIALGSGAGGSATEPAPGGPVLPTAARTSAPRLHLEDFGATEVKATVEETTRPFWLVLGQSYNDGWKATVDGRDLGPPQVLDGFANAWLVRPHGREPMAVTFTFTPQKSVWVASAISGFALLLCAALALFARRRRRSDGGHDDAPRFRSWRGGIGPAARRGALVTVSLATALVVGVIVGPFEGLALGAVVAAALRWGRTHWVLALGAPLLLAAAAGYILLQQTRYGYPPVFQWPTFFDRVHIVGWLAVVLLAADVVVEQVRERLRGPDGGPPTPTTSDSVGPANEADGRGR